MPQQDPPSADTQAERDRCHALLVLAIEAGCQLKHAQRVEHAIARGTPLDEFVLRPELDA